MYQLKKYISVKKKVEDRVKGFNKFLSASVKDLMKGKYSFL